MLTMEFPRLSTIFLRQGIPRVCQLYDCDSEPIKSACSEVNVFAKLRRFYVDAEDPEANSNAYEGSSLPDLKIFLIIIATKVDF